MYNNLKENSAKSYSYPDGILPFKIKDVKACTGRSCCVNLSCKSANSLWIRVNSHELETDSCDSCGDSKADAYYFCKKCDNYYFCKTCFHSRRKLMSCTQICFIFQLTFQAPAHRFKGQAADPSSVGICALISIKLGQLHIILTDVWN